MSALKLKIFLTKKAQEILFGYFEGVDWQIGLTTEDADGTEREMTEKEQNQIHSKEIDNPCSLYHLKNSHLRLCTFLDYFPQHLLYLPEKKRSQLEKIK